MTLPALYQPSEIAERKPMIPQAVTPGQLAAALGWSEKRLRRLAKRLGACRILSNRMVLLPEDVQTILEATRCSSSSTSEGSREADSSTTIVAQLTGVDYEARLAQRIEKSRRKLQPRSKPENPKVVSLPQRQR